MHMIIDWSLCTVRFFSSLFTSYWHFRLCLLVYKIIWTFFFFKSYKQLGIRVIEYDSYFIVLPTHPNFELVGTWTWATQPLWDPQMQKIKIKKIVPLVWWVILKIEKTQGSLAKIRYIPIPHVCLDPKE